MGETHMKSGSGKSCSVRACALAFQDLGWRVWFGRRVSRHRWRHGQARARPAHRGHQAHPLPHAQGGDLSILLAHSKTLPSCACSVGLYICIQEISKRSGHCDLLVKCSDGQVQVHSAVMAAQSKVSNDGGIPGILF